MSSEPLLSSIIRFAASGLGYAMGFAVKKILKWMLIIVGFLAGMFSFGVQLLQKYGISSGMSLRCRSSTGANVDVTNAHSLFHTLGIPLSGGLGLGFLAGFVRTR